jgi:hypothetical protein
MTLDGRVAGVSGILDGLSRGAGDRADGSPSWPA